MVAVVLEDSTRVSFDRISEGVSYRNAVFEHHTSPGAYFGARIAWTGVDWAMRTTEGAVGRFEGCGGANLKARPCGLIMSRDTDGHEIYGHRDAAGRLLRIDASGERWIAFNYDRLDRVVRARASSGDEVHYDYDERGFLARVRASGGIERRYGYSPQGQLQTITEPGAVIENIFDRNGRAVRQVSRMSIRDAPSILDVAYELTGDRVRQAEMRRSDGSWTTLSYTDSGYVAAETWGGHAATPTTVVYERDQNSRAVTSVRVTCTSPTGRGSLSYSRSPEPGAEEYARFDLLRTHCRWAEASLVLGQ